MKETPYSGKHCQNCPSNPNATQPLIEVQKLPVENRLYSKAEEYAKQEGVKPDCYFCTIVQDFIEASKNKAEATGKPQPPLFSVFPKKRSRSS